MRIFKTIAVCGSLLVSGAGSAQAAETWNFYHSQSIPQFATSLIDSALAEKIAKLSDGALNVRFRLAGTLQINAANMTLAVGGNVVQMGDDFFFSGAIPIAAIMRLPFLVQTYEDFDKAEKVLRPYVEKAYAAKGIVMLASYAYTYQYIFGRRKIETLKDIEGQKIRTSSPELGEFVRKFHGISVSMTAAEVPSALDRGVMDGLITGTVGANSWRDLIKYGYLLRLGIPNSYIIVNAARFKALSPDLQSKIRQAAEEAAALNTATLKQEDLDLYARLREAGIVLHDARPEDLREAAAAMTPYWESWAASQGPEVTEALSKVRAVLAR